MPAHEDQPRAARTGAVLPGAAIILTATQDQAISGTGGRFCLENLPPGDHEIEVRLDGFAVERRRIAVPAVGAGGVADNGSRP